MIPLRHKPLAFVLAEGDVKSALSLNEEKRLRVFIRDADSEPLKLFLPDQRQHCKGGDWYGEHLGKWLVTANLTYRRTQDPTWAEHIASVVRLAGEQQESDGWLGTYAPGSPSRFTDPEAPKNRTWDLWIHAWLILGLLDCSSIPGCEQGKEIARKIGDLILTTFGEPGFSVIQQGNHQGLSSLVILEPLARLAVDLGDSRYSELALELLEEANAAGLRFFEGPGMNLDASEIGTGKAYQLIWCLQGILALYRVVGEERLLKTVEHFWENIRAYHLTPMGGPWGGIATHKEVFNPRGFFDPRGLVETCSSASWLTLTQQLFLLTGEARYAAEIEKTLLNSILGAMDADGENWCYFTFPNGRRNNTYHWACCKSSGALALEFGPLCFATEEEGVPYLNTLQSGSFVSGAGVEYVIQADADTVTITADQDSSLVLRKPGYGVLSAADGSPVSEGEWVELELKGGEPCHLSIHSPIQVIPHTHTVDHHGQEVVREDYACVTKGPYVYATGLIQGYRVHETLRLPRLNPSSVFHSMGGEKVMLTEAGRDPILFEPYWLCGGRHNSAWRTTWLEVAWQ